MKKIKNIKNMFVLIAYDCVDYLAKMEMKCQQ